MKGGLYNVGVREVAAFDPELSGGSNAETSAGFCVQQGSENRRAIETGEAEPVERAVPGDKPRAPAISYEGVIADGRVVRVLRWTAQHNLKVRILVGELDFLCVAYVC